MQALPGLLEAGPWCYPTCSDHWTQPGQEGELATRIEYYKRVEPVAPPRDEQGPCVARLRVSHSNDRGAVGQMIWASILSNRELSNLQYIGKVADKHAKRARSSGDATIA